MAGTRSSAVADAHEGSRWINERPDGKAVADWFVANAPIAEGLKPERYVSGVTLIPAKEKPKILKNGSVVDGPEQLVYTPYVKVDTRIAYFWDYCDLRSDEWVGVIEPEPMARLSGPGVANEHLPAGAFRMPVKKADGKFVDFIGFSYRVSIYEKGTVEKVRVINPDVTAAGWKRSPIEEGHRLVGTPVRVAPAGSKVVPLLSKWGEDPFALMKAQTGAMGRALGMAGMLVVPGSGVATAEDVQEAQTQGFAGAVDATLENDIERGLAAATPAPDDLLGHARTLISRLKSDDPEALEQVSSWATERKINLNELTEQSPALRGVVRRLEQALAKK